MNLTDRLTLLNAEASLGVASGDDAVRLACDLLAAGADTPALAELAGESPKYVSWDVWEPLVRQALVELGVEPLDPTRAAWTVARNIAGRVVTGEVPADEGAHRLWGLRYACDRVPEFRALVEPLDALDWVCEAEAVHRLAEQVLRVAEERLA